MDVILIKGNLRDGMPRALSLAPPNGITMLVVAVLYFHQRHIKFTKRMLVHGMSSGRESGDYDSRGRSSAV